MKVTNMNGLEVKTLIGKTVEEASKICNKYDSQLRVYKDNDIILIQEAHIYKKYNDIMVEVVNGQTNEGIPTKIIQSCFA